MRGRPSVLRSEVALSELRMSVSWIGRPPIFWPFRPYCDRTRGLFFNGFRPYWDRTYLGIRRGPVRGDVGTTVTQLIITSSLHIHYAGSFFLSHNTLVAVIFYNTWNENETRAFQVGVFNISGQTWGMVDAFMITRNGEIAHCSRTCPIPPGSTPSTLDRQTQQPPHVKSIRNSTHTR
ncbi:hypothetical protein BV25DRAFT_1626808 [Artomyces pyxidatus]|uniref:Uncharacterized protein n=1 Tax=Artomyces pyxidatus TaxID=48021 RepID=A0ACB8SID9_9AGAM|nr:hypothetical protein BV25DRAFT_1626808 [Artomyces pyxidatus]